MKYGVQSAVFSDGIHVGRLNDAETEFIDKEEASDMVLFAVAKYVQTHFDSKMICDFPDAGLEIEISVKSTR